jgi:hypothetical protein
MERKLITVAVATALGLPMAAVAVEGSVSGHVNMAIVKVDDGDATITDANGSETRFRFTGSEELDNGLTAGVTLEVGASGGRYSNSTGGTTGAEAGDGTGGKSDLRVRHANVSLSSAAGTLTIGQQNTPADAVQYADVGSTWIAGATNWCSYGIGGGAACVNNETGRKRAVRYDAPSIGPVSLGVAVGNDDYWDAAAQISGSAGDAGYNLRVGYNGQDGNEDLMAGASVTVGSTGVAVNWTDGEDANGDNDSVFFKLDQSYGDGSVAVYYKQGENSTGEGDQWGLAVAHSLGGGATAYAGYRMVDNDADADSIDGFLAGLRVTFN